MKIQLQGLSKSYEEAGKSHWILNNVNAVLPSNQLTVLLGKSGCGKSTLLNLIAGIDLPEAGQIWIGDREVTRLNDHERTLFRRRKIGFVFQFFNLIPTLSVLENVTLIQDLDQKTSNSKDDKKKVIELLDQVGLADRKDSMPDQLSGGEQQRVALARALAHDPELILADEPTGNLDQETGDRVLALMIDLIRKKGKTLVVATHSSDILTSADHIFKIHEGDLIPFKSSPVT